MAWPGFHEATNLWFDQTFAHPTAAQRGAWQHISEGSHTLVSAPTGSGKTLAAFLASIDRLYRRLLEAPGEEFGVRVIYVSPLKALAYDVERNLRAPVVGIYRALRHQGLAVRPLRVATRSGDTAARDRQQMFRESPEILVTTPESFYLLLSSKAHEHLLGTETIIFDEVHSIAGGKRGAHLALSFERLAELQRRAGLGEFQRIGLSATQTPIQEIAKFLGGLKPARSGHEFRPVQIVEEPSTRELEVTVRTWTKDMAQIGQLVLDGDRPKMSGAAAGDPYVRYSIWDDIHRQVASEIREHATTLVFVNSRRQSERLAAMLNEELGADVVRAHHGSLSKGKRAEIESLLKGGFLKAIVATSSLELGIDMGSIDLVIQVEAPQSISSGIQRIGRANHRVGEVPTGVLIPKHRHDLVVCAVSASSMLGLRIETTVIPRNPLDVLAQQIVAMAVSLGEPVQWSRLLEVARSCYSFMDISEAALQRLVEMLSGTGLFAGVTEVVPRIFLDPVSLEFTARKGARLAVVMNPGVIPDRGLYRVVTLDGSLVGELDEEMVFETRPGEIFVLGASSWKVSQITKDRVIVEPAPGQPGKTPFWKGEGLGRSFEFGKELADFFHDAEGGVSTESLKKLPLDENSKRNLVSYLDDQLSSDLGLLPTSRRLVVELFPDELGDETACLLSPFGARVNAPWALAIEEVLAKDGYKTRVVWSDEGVAFRMPEGFTASLEDVIVLAGQDLRDLVITSLSSSPLLLNTFRQCATRALLFSKKGPVARVPLWLQRQKAEELLYVARSIEGFPILAETYREILADSFDLAGLGEVIRSLQAAKMALEIRQTPRASPFSASMTFGYVANFIYESSAPLAEARAMALGLDRLLLSDLLGEAEARNLLDPDSIQEVDNELQRVKEELRAEDAGDLQALLRLLGDLSADEVRERVSCHVSYLGLVDELISTRRAIWIRIGGEPRLILSSEAGMYRDALGVQIPSGLPALSLDSPPRPLERILRRATQRRSPFTAEYLKARFFLDDLTVSDYLAFAVERGELVVAEIDGQPGHKSWVAPDVLQRIRLRSLAKARSEVEAVGPATISNYLVEYQGLSTPRSGQSGLTAALGQMAGMELPPELLESEILPSRVDGYSGAMLDLALSSGEFVWLGTLTRGGEERVVIVPRSLLGVALSALSRRGVRARINNSEAEEREFDENRRLEARLQALGSAYFGELVPNPSDGIAERTTIDALWRLVFEGKVHNDSFAAYRAWRNTRGRRGGARRVGQARHRGRLNLSSLRWRTEMTPPSAAGRWTWIGGEEPRAEGDLNLYEIESAISRWGFLSRAVAGAEAIPGGFQGLYRQLSDLEMSGTLRRGYFIEGFGGSQFFISDAIEVLRDVHRRTISNKFPTYTICTADPAWPYGTILAWRDISGSSDPSFAKRLRRKSGCYVTAEGGVPWLYLDVSAGWVASLYDESLNPWDLGELELRARTSRALDALLERATERNARPLAIREADPRIEGLLKERGFRPTPKGWTAGSRSQGGKNAQHL